MQARARLCSRTSSSSENNAQASGGGRSNSNPPLRACKTLASKRTRLNDHSSAPQLSGVRFLGNVAAQFGGGMINRNGSSPNLVEVVFDGNWAARGGAMLNDDDSAPTLSGVDFIENAADSSGGGLHDAGTAELTDVAFREA